MSKAIVVPSGDQVAFSPPGSNSGSLAGTRVICLIADPSGSIVNTCGKRPSRAWNAIRPFVAAVAAGAVARAARARIRL
jgi:hypothetical protein